MTTRNSRIHIRAPLSLEVIFEGISGKREARISDISLGGCYVDAMQQVGGGEMVKLKIRLPSGEWISLNGNVVYTSQIPSGFGVRFTEMSDEARSSLDKAINDYLEKHGGR
jgi:PilZ domain